MPADFKPPRKTPARSNHLQSLVNSYARDRGLATDRAMRWLSVVSLTGVLEAFESADGPRFLIKGGTSMELRLGIGARATKDVDIVFRGDPEVMVETLEDAFEHPYGGFSFRRKGEVEAIRDTGSRRLAVQVEFGGRPWQTLLVEVARPEADEPELVPVAIGIEDFKLPGPNKVACLSLRYQVAQKIHAVTEQPEDRQNLRFWDLVDLILLRDLLGNSLEPTHLACEEIFAKRDTHRWPPELVVPDDWADPYAEVAAEIAADLPTDVDTAAAEVRAFIAVIDAAADRAIPS